MLIHNRERFSQAPADGFGAIAFSPDGRILASGAQDNIQLWDTHTGQQQAVFETDVGSVQSLAFSPDGGILASTGSGSVVRLWNLDTQALKTTLGKLSAGNWTPSLVTFSPDGKTLASSGAYGVQLWDPNAGSHLFTLRGGHTGKVYSLTFSPDSKTLASGGNDRAVILWDVANGRYRNALEGHTRGIGALAFSPDGGTLMSGSWDGTILLWELTPSERDLSLIPDSQTSSDVNGDGVVNIQDLTLVASGFGQTSPDINGDGVVNILDLTLVASQLSEGVK